MNRVVLMGRLTRDPEIRYSQGNEPVCIANFSLAVDRRKSKNNDEQQADFPRCTVFGKTAEFCEKYLMKGTKVVLEGRLQTGSYTNREGQKVYTTDVIVDNIEFAESKKADGNAQANTQPPQGNYANAPQQGYQQPQQGAQQGYQQQGYQQQGAPQGYQPQQAAPQQGYQQPNAAQQGYQQPNGNGFMNIPQGIDEELPWN